MKRIASVLWLLLLASPPAFVQETPAPTQLEKLAADPSTVTVVDRDVGGMDSKDAFMSVAVLSLEDGTHRQNRMLGVRFDLRHETVADRVYLDETQLSLLRTEVELIDSTWRTTQQQSRRALAPGGTIAQGTASCWMPDPALRILCPSYRLGSDWSGLKVGAYGGPTFAFPDRQPRDLLELLDRAIAELAAIKK